MANTVNLLFGYSEEFGLQSEGCLGSSSFPRTAYHTDGGGNIYPCLFTDKIHSLPRLAGEHERWFLSKCQDHTPALPESPDGIV